MKKLRIYKVLKNPILQVFTKEYHEETLYRKQLQDNVDKMKLQDNNYDVDNRIKVLQKSNFKSNFNISIN